MNEFTSSYSIGDWVVHYAYGIGQIKKIEEKPLGGELTSCFQVKAQNGAEWWFRINTVDNPRIRPVASPEAIRRAEEALVEPVQDLEEDKSFWKDRIDEVTGNGDFLAITRIVRDLTALKGQRKLNQIESRALHSFEDRLIREWSATTNKNLDATQMKLEKYLRAYS